MSDLLTIDEAVLGRAMDEARTKGAAYADIRVDPFLGESASAENGAIKGVGRASGTTIGVRALAGGAWGFASAELNDPAAFKAVVRACVVRAIRQAKVAKGGPAVELAAVQVAQATVPARAAKKPVDMDRKKALAQEMSSAAAAVETIVLAAASVGHSRTLRHFWSTEGTRIIQEILHVSGDLYANGREGSSAQSYYRSFGAHGGWEYMDRSDPVGLATRVAERTRDLVRKARVPKNRETIVVTPGEFNALTVHEVVGHPSEGDRVLGGESAWAGRAWWTEQRGNRVASDKITAVSDARPLERHAGFYGTFAYDDEGVPAQRIVHIEKGILKDFLHSRQTAALVGGTPSGAMRASAAGVAPLIRMTNTYFEPDPEGPKTLEEAIEDVKDGVLFGHQSIPSIDSRRYRFQINAFEGWEIKDGEIGQLLKNISLVGRTPEYFGSVYRVGGPSTWQLHQIPNCGKGDPMQSMRVGNGGPLFVGKGRVSGGA